MEPLSVAERAELGLFIEAEVAQACACCSKQSRGALTSMIQTIVNGFLWLADNISYLLGFVRRLPLSTDSLARSLAFFFFPVWLAHLLFWFVCLFS